MINIFPGFIMTGLQLFFGIFRFFIVARDPCQYYEMGGFTRANIFISLLVLSTMTIISSQKIHDEMTRQERALAFLSDNDDILDYEVVPVYWPRVQKRDVYGRFGVKLRAFGSHIKLWLNPVDGILAGDEMPIYNVRSGPDGPQIGKYNKPIKKIGVRMYEDLAKAAAIAVNYGRNGTKRITGVIGSEKLTIRPVPERLIGRVARHRRSIDGNHLPEENHYHIVYKTPDAIIAEPLRSSSITCDRKRYVPDVVYPEILVLVDHDLYKKFRKSLWELVPYLLGFWNGVDMRYRSLENPKYRLNIAGFVVPEDSQAFDFINHNRHDNKTLIGYNVLMEFGDWLRKHNDTIPLTSYDVAAIMSLNGLCIMASDHKCYGDILGMAFVGGICKGNQPNDIMLKVMVIQDHAGYDGIYTAVHELGHSLGAHHDGTVNSTCPYEDGFIMTGSPRSGLNSTLWSQCSLSNFTSFIDTEPECIYNKPEQGAKLPRYLPGRIMDADEQCKVLKGTRAYRKDASICLSLTCGSPEQSDDYVHVGSPAADGTSCGKGRICLYGRCLLERNITW